MSNPSKTNDLKKNIRNTLKNRPDGELPYKKNTRKAVSKRDERAGEWQDFSERRAHISSRRREDIEDLHSLHKTLRDNLKSHGVIIHDAEDSDSACRHVLDILHKHKIDRLLKSKTMLSEEIELNSFLTEHGVTPVETDLGEYIVQLRGETPSHITMPAMHLTREDVGRLFEEKLHIDYTDNPEELTDIARNVLRQEFLAAGAGLCGVNFAVAETGHIATVTNEGNGRMVTTLPRVVIALMGWERVTRSLEDLSLLWQMLARSATGQKATVYLNLMRGASPGPSGPDEVHIIIVDNGRKDIYEDLEMREMLRCIRCGACLNVCPVYQQVGGHPYGGVYPGPMGKVISPLLLGLDNAPDHPFASTLCGACEEICPVSIPLPELMLLLRSRKINLHRGIDYEAPAWKTFEKMMSNEKNYNKATKAARNIQRYWMFGNPPIPGWTRQKDNPDIAPVPFRDLFDKIEDDQEPDDE
ncbi:MAG: lactate utilization protein B [Candidatus Electryonea clarkiae]|nr:lactate utilization protein B [Candidatus Electryonea clarkiae]MDP8285557.1 lactate utilization protein B [Candidatus Electryonea clarkiae]